MRLPLEAVGNFLKGKRNGIDNSSDPESVRTPSHFVFFLPDGSFQRLLIGIGVSLTDDSNNPIVVVTPIGPRAANIRVMEPSHGPCQVTHRWDIKDGTGSITKREFNPNTREVCDRVFFDKDLTALSGPRGTVRGSF